MVKEVNYDITFEKCLVFLDRYQQYAVTL